MKKFFAVLFLLLCAPTLIYGQKTRFGQAMEKPNPAEYSIKVHVSATHIRHYCFGWGDNVSCSDQLYADAIVKGKKIELSGADIIVKKIVMLIVPGDYPVKITKDNSNSDSTLFNQEYEILLPDGTVWKCFTSGISE